MPILSTPFAIRSYEDGDLNDLERIERLAGNAYWTRNELEIFAARLDVDFRVVIKDRSPAQLVAFYVVEHGDETLYLANIAVTPEWRRRGIATFALESVAELGYSLQYRQIALDVQEENLAAQLLYRKAGFRVERIHRMHYPGQDGYFMIKVLQA